MDSGEKRLRDNCDVEEASAKRRALRVNDILTLQFVREDGTSIQSVHPTYTHQIFENECVALLNESQPKINVTIRLSDLQHQAEIQGTLEQSENEHIKEKLEPVVPESSCAEISIGQKIHEFEVGVDKFAITLAKNDDNGAAALLNTCEKMAMWFIETADSVDFSDRRWEAMFVHRKGLVAHSNEFVGYMTLFTFNNPIVGSKLRICQALVLPPFQKALVAKC